MDDANICSRFWRAARIEFGAFRVFKIDKKYRNLHRLVVLENKKHDNRY